MKYKNIACNSLQKRLITSHALVQKSPSNGTIQITFVAKKGLLQNSINYTCIPSNRKHFPIRRIFKSYFTLYLITADSSNMSGNHPRSHTLSANGINAISSPPSVSNASWFLPIWSATIRIRRIASIDVSGNCGLQANSDKHFTQSWRYGAKTDQFETIVFDAIDDALVNAN